MSSTTNTNEEPIIPAPPSIPPQIDSTDNKSNGVQEPPHKRMKVDSPQVPHYNSHNIYSRPPAPPSNIAIPSLPPIVSPVTPLESAYTNNNHNHNLDVLDAASGVTIAPLPPPTEEWPLCAFCNKGGDLSRCSSCRQAYYCNRQCQVAHWEVHCIICQPGPPQPPSLPQGGQPVAAPTSYPHYTPTQQPQYSPRTPQSKGYDHHNGTSHTSSRRSTSSNRRTYQDSDGVEKEQYYCEECDRYFKNGQALGGHRSRVHSSRRNGAVDEHGMPIHTPRKRRRPSRARHEPGGNGQYVCPHCGREFATGNALGGHISGAHTKKSKRNAQLHAQLRAQQAAGNYDYAERIGYARPRHPNL